MTLEVNEAQQERITEHSRASIGSLSLLGEPIIVISPSAQGRRLVDGDFIPSDAAPPAASPSMAAPVSAGVEEATKLIQDIRAGKGTVGKLMTDEALYREFNALLGVGRRGDRRHQPRPGDARQAGPRRRGLPAAERGARRI